MRLLLVEDDPMVGESIRDGLGQDGYTVDWVRDGKGAETALERARDESWTVVSMKDDWTTVFADA